MLDSDTTLREKIRILFKEQGITIASVLAAISLAISTLVSLVVAAVRGAGTPAVTPEPPAPELPAPKPKPPEPSSIKEWIQKHLQNLANAFKNSVSRHWEPYQV